MAALVAMLTALLMRLTPSWVGDEGKPQAGYIFVNLATRFLRRRQGLCDGVGGGGQPDVPRDGAGIIVLALAALSALQARGKQPVWYQLTLVALTPMGVLAGGLVRLRVLGIL